MGFLHVAATYFTTATVNNIDTKHYTLTTPTSSFFKQNRREGGGRGGRDEGGREEGGREGREG